MNVCILEAYTICTYAFLPQNETTKRAKTHFDMFMCMVTIGFGFATFDIYAWCWMNAILAQFYWWAEQRFIVWGRKWKAHHIEMKMPRFSINNNNTIKAFLMTLLFSDVIWTLNVNSNNYYILEATLRKRSSLNLWFHSRQWSRIYEILRHEWNGSRHSIPMKIVMIFVKWSDDSQHFQRYQFKSFMMEWRSSRTVSIITGVLFDWISFGDKWLYSVHLFILFHLNKFLLSSRLLACMKTSENHTSVYCSDSSTSQ